MYRQWVLTALLAWPALAALVVMVAPARWAKHVALAASLVEFAISAPLWWTFAPADGFQFILDASWIPSWGIRYTVGVDGISLFMVLLTTFLVPLSVLGSRSEEHTSELQSPCNLVCRLLLEKKKYTASLSAVVRWGLAQPERAAPPSLLPQLSRPTYTSDSFARHRASVRPATISAAYRLLCS